MSNEILVDEPTMLIHADDGGAPDHCIKYTRTEALTQPKPDDVEELVDDLEVVIGDTHEVDVSDRDYAVAVVDYLKAQGYTIQRGGE